MFTGFQEVLNGTRSAEEQARRCRRRGRRPRSRERFRLRSRRPKGGRNATRDGRQTQCPRAPAKAGSRPGARQVPAVHRQQSHYAILFIAPGLLIYLVFMVYPFLNTMYLGFTNWNGVTAPQGVSSGCANYIRISGTACLESVLQHRHLGGSRNAGARRLGLFQALLVWTGPELPSFWDPLLPPVRASPGGRWHRVAVDLPSHLRAPEQGPRQHRDSNEASSRGWLADPHTALYAILVRPSGERPGSLLVLLASLQNVDVSQVEAAMLDGANWPQRPGTLSSLRSRRRSRWSPPSRS